MKTLAGIEKRKRKPNFHTGYSELTLAVIELLRNNPGRCFTVRAVRMALFPETTQDDFFPENERDKIVESLRTAAALLGWRGYLKGRRRKALHYAKSQPKDPAISTTP